MTREISRETHSRRRYSRREATSQKMDEIKYLLLLPVSWNKKLLNLTVAWMGQVA